MNNTKTISIETTINANIEKVWNCWTGPSHIKQWYNASEDWHTPNVQNDLKEGGKFIYRMEAKDGSFGFDFEGTYSEIKQQQFIAYSLADERKVTIQFKREGNTVNLVETFEPESENPLEMQKTGWQAILNNFKHYTESQNDIATD